ncbi:MAG TPA: xanthine dehydrogenase family protein molybdopterin-binding subunit, partial [Burkholderiales bacterium]|nr:xanthine dehydrogenase family protein molybdopterin-binding subunit [Burkholderiales bacterium]
MRTHPDHHGHGERVEDFRLITGAGKYASDWRAPGQLYGSFLRADRAHGEIISIDIAHALASPGVKYIFTGADAVTAGYTRAPHSLTFPGRNGMKARAPDRPALAHGKVRFVGEAIALVVAENATQAQDAAELIAVEYRDLPCVVNAEEALSEGAPQLHDGVPGNLAFESETGDAHAVASALANAAHVTRLKVEVSRVAPSPMEPRACLVAYDAASGDYSFKTCMQGTTTLRRQLSSWTNVPEENLKFEAHDVGGGFGQRTLAYPEYCALMIAAKASGKPVKWISTRMEGFLADSHGRSNTIEGALALDRDGRFLAMRLDWVNDMGAYLSPGAMGHIRNTTTCMTGVYRIPALYGTYRVALINCTPVAAYRGAGRPDIAYVVERLVSQAAVELKVDPAELRRRNFIPPEAFPYRTPTGSVYENADLPGMLTKALKLADWNGFPQRRSQSAVEGKLRGIGISTVIENTGAGNAPKDEIEIRVDASSAIAVYTVSKAQGHGHETTLAMIVADALGVAREKVKIVQCEYDTPLEGNHTGGSRTTVGAGSVCFLAAQNLIEQGKTLAALELKVEPSQVSYAHGEFSSPESARRLPFADIAKEKTLSVKAEGKFGSTFPNGCHIAEVEIDPDTGATKIVSYCAVDDCGTVIHHAIVEGQLHGGVVQGAGQIFGEHIAYDPETGQPLSASFLDYAMPRAGLLPALRGEEHPTPSKVSPLGVKGMGESGCTASLPVLANAVIDALRQRGVDRLDMPFTPSKVWHALNAAAGR